MVEQAIHFNDGDVYERTMGVWSRLAGELFLDWLKPRPGIRWIDVGCGSGAFTELLVQRCAPAGTQGIDPSEAQLALHAAGQRRTGRKSSRATRWRCLSPTIGSMPRSWRW
jgi:trans-aconitate methyltransferase